MCLKVLCLSCVVYFFLFCFVLHVCFNVTASLYFGNYFSQLKNNLVSSPFHPTLIELSEVCCFNLCMIGLFHNFLFAFSLSFFLSFCFIPLVLVLFCSPHYVSVIVHPSVGTCVWLWFAHFLPLIEPSGEPVIPRSPQLSALSLRSSSCFSSTFPWCRPNPLAANGKPKCHGHLSKRELCHRSRGGWLCQPVSHTAVLPIHRVALQQIRPRPPPWGCFGQVSISGQYPEGPKVRQSIFI